MKADFLEITGTFTVEPLEESLRFWLDRVGGLKVGVRFGGYNQVFQELVRPPDPGCLARILLIRPDDWGRFSEDSGKDLIEETATELIAVLKAQSSGPPITVVFCPGTVDHGSLERRVSDAVMDSSLVRVISSAWVLERYPVSRLHDPESDREGHIPYQPEFFSALATVIARQCLREFLPSPKVLVLDADNTLWKGVVGELGVEGVEISEPYLAVQRLALAQKEAGLLIAVCSKNVEADVRAVFHSRSEMRLKESDIVTWKVNWLSKSENLRALANELNLGLDSFVFLDDNPVECAEVMGNCPEVLTLTLPGDLNEFPTFLEHVWVFDSAGRTATDAQRTALYQQEQERRSFETQADNYAAFLAGLKLEITTIPITDDHLPRLAQLTLRTNQFNATTRRFTESEVRDWLAGSQREARLFQVKDRFGDYGITGLLMTEAADGMLEVENFLLSCRVLGKGVEHAMVRMLAEVAEVSGCDCIQVRIVETERNQPARDFFAEHFGAYTQSQGVYQFSPSVAAGIQLDPAKPRVAANAAATPFLKASVRAPSELVQRIATEWRLPKALQAILNAEATQARSDFEYGYVEPRTETEKALAAIWEAVLRLDRVGRDDGFFDLGGRSILATRLVSRIAERFQVSLSLRDIFEMPSLREQAALIDESVKVPVPAIQVHHNRETSELSPAQERLWFLDQFEKDLSAYNIPLAFRLEGPVDVTTLQEAIAMVVKRHQVLNACFPSKDGRARQQCQAEPAFGWTHIQAENGDIALEEAHRPFDLENGPVLRVVYVDEAADVALLILNVHHISSDGWSSQLLLQEISAAYAKQALTPLPVQYADYASCQRGRTFDGELEYWKRQLAATSGVLELPTDFPRPAKVTYNGDVVRAHLPASLNLRLETLAQQEGASSFMLLLAAFQTLLYRYSGQEDLLVGTPISGRNQREIEPLIGCFINTLVIRGAPEGSKTFRDFLAEVRATTLEAYEHQEVPFNRLVDELNLPRNLSHTPLFQAMFVLQNTDPQRLTLPGVTVTPLPIHNGGAKTDFVMELTPCEGGYALCLEYNTDLYRKDTATRLLGHFTRLLGSICENPLQSLDALPMLTTGEREALLAKPNRDLRTFEPGKCLHEIFADKAATVNERLAVTFEGQSLSYRELDQRANQLAHVLIAHGAGPDVLIAICMDRSIDLVVGLLAILKSGSAYLPIDLSYPADRLAFMLEDGQAPVLLTQSSLEKDLPSSKVHTVFLDQLALSEQPECAPDVKVKPSNLAYVIYTSGSTGLPKGTLVTHHNVVRLFQATDDWFHFNENDVWTLFHSYAFDFSVWELWGALLYGGRLVVPAHSVNRSPEDFYKLLSEEKVTVLNQTPSAFRQLIQAEREARGRLPLALRTIIFGGEALEMQTLKPWFDRHGDQTPLLVNMYGITETTVHVTYRPLSAADLDRGSVIGERIPDLELYILDPNKEPVPIGVPGEMYVGGAGLARGYLNRDELTAARFIPHPFSEDPAARLYRTGDLARFLPDFDVEYLGRIDLQVKIRGFRIELGEIENILNQHTNVRESVVLAREDIPGDKRLTAYIVADDHPPSIEDLRQTLKVKVPDYMVPSSFVFLPVLPLTTNGKLDRKALPAPEPERPDLDSLFVPPSSATETAIAEIWKDVLRVEQVGVNDNFFELGGDSILSIQIISQCRKAGYPLSPKHLFDHQTIAELAHAASTLETPPPVKASTLPTSAFALTPIQSWFFEHGFAGENHWNQAFLFEVTETLDVEKLKAALHALCEHHDALRLTFNRRDAQYYGATPSSKLLVVESNKEVSAIATRTQGQLDIAKGDLLRAVYFTHGQLLLVVHHLAVDGVSWRILIEDLETLMHGQALPAKTSSFADWQEALTRYQPSSTFWKTLDLKPTSLPYDVGNPGKNTEHSAETLTVHLSEAETQDLLTKVPARHGTQINDVMVTALSVALKTDHLCFDLEAHGREDLGDESLDLSRTVGWFTSIYPVAIDLSAAATLSERLASVKRQLAAIPNHGIDYGILRYVKPGILPAHADRKLVFNYLGRIDQMTRNLALFKVTGDPTGPWHSPQSQRTHELEVNAMIIQDRLQISWTFSRNLHRAETIQAVADRYADALRQVVGRTETQTFPLSPMQRLFYQLGSTRTNYKYDQWFCRLLGPLDIQRFKTAWNTVINRHAVLRSTFESEAQIVHEHVTPVWNEVETSDINGLITHDRQAGNDLSTAPLSRFTLSKLGPEEHFFLWSLPDLQMDGWSWPIVFGEVSALYRGEVLGEVRPYHDYLQWLATHDQPDTEKFWRDHLAGFKHATPLPTDLAHHKPSRVVHEVQATVEGELSAVARKLHTTPGALVQAAWAILLSAASGQDAVVFGAAFSGRPAELEGVGGIVGPFTNNLPIRVQLRAEQPVAALARHLQGRVFELSAYQHAPITDIQEWSELPWCERLFESLVVIQNYQVGDGARQLSETVCIKDFEGPVHTNYPLTLIATPGRRLTLDLAYKEGACSKAQAERIVRCLKDLLVQIMAQPEMPTAELQSSVALKARVPVRRASGSESIVAPRTTLEKKLADLWKLAFGLERVSVEDNFFDLGGHSLLMTRVHQRVASITDRPLSVVEMFQYPTIRALAKHLEPDSNTSAEEPIKLVPANAHEGVAIVGMAGRFPGASNVDSLWEILTEGKETITTFSKCELAPGEPADDPDYIPRRGILEKPDHFDAAFFNISPNEAKVTDPQQRLFLESAWSAMEHAGYDPQQIDGPVGVYAGMGNNSYYLNNVHHNRDLRNLVGAEVVMIGNEKDYLATRVAYKLNLSGPAVNVHTACSTSLVAICEAVRGLLAGQCQMALAGGVSVKFPQERGYVYEEGSLFSSDGHCRSFDAGARGTVFSNGVGVVVLKRVSEAVRDGDQIYAVIRGTGLNNDGSDKVSFTAPSVDGQAAAVQMAHREANIDPETISYVEAHGTGTPLGDPIEVAGLTKAFRVGTEKVAFCGLGSLKTNIGHLDAAAGVAGLIKTALALHHKQIPATLHQTKPHPNLGIDGSPFRIISQKEPWVSEGTPRRAGVSSLGIGGTNAHVVLEEAPETEASSETRGAQLILLSAKTETALEKQRENLIGHLQQHSDVNLADLAYTLKVGRQAFSHRLALVADSVEDALTQLQCNDPKTVSKRHQEQRQRPVTFMFPGQGAQHFGMGAGLYDTEPVFRDTVDHCAGLLTPLIGVDLREVLYRQDADAANDLLQDTRITQPALFVTEYAMAKIWLSWGIEPAAMIGHSVGEYVAGCLSGVFTLDDCLRLVVKRAKLVHSRPPGTMLAIRKPEAEVLPLLGSAINVAAVNSPSSTVVAGSFSEIEALETTLKEQGILTKRLRTSHAFHSHMMDEVVPPFTEILKQVDLKAPRIPYVSNVTAEWITAEEATSPAYWAAHVRQTVRFADGIEKLLQETDGVFLEIGPGTTLANFTRQHPRRSPQQGVASSVPAFKDVRSEEQRLFLKALGELWLDGAAIDWQKLYIGERRRRLPLPTYPFESVRYCAPSLTTSEETVPLGETILTPTSTPLATAAPAGSRRDHLADELQNQIALLSGLETSALTPSATFLDLGFDSLFLTQASLVLKKHFGVKISFRQLMEDLTTIDDLANYLDRHLPPDKFVPPVPAAAPALTPIPAVASSPLTLEQRVACLEARLGAGFPDPTPARMAETTTPAGIRVESQNINPTGKIVYGPFRPVGKVENGRLTPQQEKHLGELVANYNARTGGSKRYTQEHRAILADPRSAAGFNPLWKDLVYPIVADRSEGSKIWDIDGNEYIDVTLGFGLSLFGHRPKFVTEAIKAQLDRGVEIGPSHPLSGEVARMIAEISGMDRVSFCNTGSEAVMAALRISRTVTGRNKVVMFTGAYHGIFDEVLVRPLVTNGELRSMPIAPGITGAAVEEIIVLEYGNPESLEIIRRHGDEIAAVLVETVQSRRPDLQPVDFLKKLRAITKASGSALIFDEVVTGFRACLGGNQERFGIKADIVTYGKVVGGGLPIGVLAGSKYYMDALDGGFWQYGDDSFPEVGVTFFAGTFVRHPLALAAAKAVLTHLQEEGPDLQRDLEERTTALVAKLNAVATSAGVPIKVTQFSSLYFFNFAPELKFASLLFVHMRMRGLHIWESRGSFISTAHSELDIQRIVDVFSESVAALQEGGFFPAGPQTGAMVLPLTAAQEELFLADRMSNEASLACHESITITLSGALDLVKLTEVVNTLIARHEALRMTFREDGSAQEIAPSLTIQVPIDDPKPNLRAAIVRELETPFDLVNGPLIRARVFNVAKDEHQLVIVVHHIICDGWSFDVLVNEIGQLYAGASISTVAESFLTYVREERESLASEDFAATKAYWLAQFTTPPPMLDLPTDHTRPAQKTYPAASYNRSFDTAVTEKMQAFCKEQGYTPYVFLLGAYAALLGRLSGQDTVVIGTPVAGQVASGHQNLVGHCVHFLPMRLSLDPSASVRAHLDSVRRVALDGLDHQVFTLGHLLKEMKGTRDPSRPAFVSTTFTLEAEGRPIESDGLRMEADVTPRTHSGFELSLFVVSSGANCRVMAVYNTSLYEAETVERWLAQYETLVKNVLVTPLDTPLAEISFLTAAEREQVLVQWNRSKTGAPPIDPTHVLFESIAAQYSNKPAVISLLGSRTYQELNEQANAFAHYLRERGVKGGDFVGVYLERSPDMVVALLAVLKTGAAYLPIDPSYPSERIQFMLEDADAPVIVTQSSMRQALNGNVDIIEMDGPAWDRSKIENLTNASTCENLAYVIYTSGSTGRPKGVMIPHRGIVRLVRNTNYATFGPEEVFLQAANISFDASTMELWGPLLNGGTLALLPPGTPSLEDIGQAVRDYGVTTLWLTSGLFQLMVDERLDDLSNVRQLIAGGDVLPKEHVRKALAKLPGKLINGYGPTENTTFTCCHTISAKDVNRASIPIGGPISNTQVYILDEAQRPVAIGMRGELYIGGAGLSTGYLNNPELTQKRFIPHPFSDDPRAVVYRSGDLCRWLPDGTIEFFGRIDNQLKIRGFRIEPGEVESVLAQHPGVAQSAVTAFGTTAGDKALAAYVVPHPGITLTVEDIRTNLGQILPPSHMPSFFTLLHRLPVTLNGKIDYQALPEPDQAALFEKENLVEPNTSTEKRLAALWSETLGVGPLGLHESFFDLGGHSLLGLRLFSRIHKEFGTALPLSTLFQTPTIGQLAKLLDNGNGNRDGDHGSLSAQVSAPKVQLPQSVIAIQESGSGTPTFWIHGGDGGTLFYRHLAETLNGTHPFYTIEAPMLVDRSLISSNDTVEEIARRYLKLIRAVRPNGPYILGGYSFGGIVAYEMAQQLCAQCGSVEKLILIDTPNPAVERKNRYTLTQRISANWRNNRDQALAPRIGNLAKRMTEGIRSKRRHHREVRRAMDLLRSGEEGTEDIRVIQVRETHTQIIEKYVPKTYPGTIFLFRADRQSDYCYYSEELGWENLVQGGIEIIDIPGKHLEIFEEPHREVLASHFHSVINSR